jgi:thioesterase domain-containing protein
MLAAREYRSVPHDGISYDGKITLFLAAERDMKGSADPVEEWQSLAKGAVQAISVPGDHVTMLREPNVRVLADKLDECLSEINRALGAD